VAQRPDAQPGPFRELADPPAPLLCVCLSIHVKDGKPSRSERVKPYLNVARPLRRATMSGGLVVGFEDLGGEFTAAAHADLLEDRLEVVLDGVRGDE
jgi:hypothetical protein